eukprot:scaffold1228_cov115-Isochrysis_galbana.AAC.17
MAPHQVWPVLRQQRRVGSIVCESARRQHRVVRGDEALLAGQAARSRGIRASFAADPSPRTCGPRGTAPP